MSLPDAVDAGQGQWRATVSISASPVGGMFTSAKKCEFPHAFPSREAALQYATEQCRLKASQASLHH
jgi:hypothetical protein